MLPVTLLAMEFFSVSDTAFYSMLHSLMMHFSPHILHTFVRGDCHQVQTVA